MANDTRLHGKIATITEAQAYHVARLGGTCVCCGETNTAFLEVCPVVDSPTFSSGFDNPGAFYAYLDKYEKEASVEVLCANCNHAKGRLGICPHEKARDLTWSPDFDIHATEAEVRQLLGDDKYTMFRTAMLCGVGIPASLLRP